MPHSDHPPSSVGLAVVGASAGGVEALTGFVAALPAGLACPVLVVLHISQSSVLPQILARSGPLEASAVADGDVLTPGHLHVAPPGRHVLVEGTTLRLSLDPPDHSHRPSIDVIMCSAADALGPRTVGIVLSGTLDDGTAGLAAIQDRGGRVLVQDPEEALRPEMPRSALGRLRVDASLPVGALARWLAEAAGGSPTIEEAMPGPPDPTGL